MALPTPIKTWQHRVNQPAGGTGEMDSFQHAMLALKNMLTDTIIGSTGFSAHIYKRGNIQLVSGTTFRVNPGDDTFDPAKIGGVVGRTMKLRGMTSGANDGDFTVTAQTDQGGGVFALEYVNATPAIVEVIVGSVNVLSGTFTNPMVMHHSASQPDSSVPADGDEVDRIETFTDWSFSAQFNNSYFILRNPVTKTEICILTGNTTPTNDGARGNVIFTTAPNTLSAPPAINASRDDGLPVGTTRDFNLGSFAAHRQYFFGNDPFLLDDNVAFEARVNVQYSSDGEQMRAWMFVNGLPNVFMFDATVLNPKTEWAADPDTPVVAGIHFPGNVPPLDGTRFTHWNDTAFATCSRIPSPGPGALPGHVPAAFLSSEGYGSATLGQNLVVANELTGEWPMLPVGIVTSDLRYRGRMGVIPDLFWTSDGLNPGQTFPNDITRTFWNLGDLAVVGNGSRLETV